MPIVINKIPQYNIAKQTSHFENNELVLSPLDSFNAVTFDKEEELKEECIVEISELLSKFCDYNFDYVKGYGRIKGYGHVDIYVNDLECVVNFLISQELSLKQVIEERIEIFESSLVFYDKWVNSVNKKIAKYKQYLLDHEDENVIDLDAKNELESCGYAYTKSLNAFNIDNKKRKYLNSIKNYEEFIKEAMIRKNEDEKELDHQQGELNMVNEKLDVLQYAKRKIEKLKSIN